MTKQFFYVEITDTFAGEYVASVELQRLANRRGHTVGFIASWEA